MGFLSRFFGIESMRKELDALKQEFEQIREDFKELKLLVNKIQLDVKEAKVDGGSALSKSEALEVYLEELEAKLERVIALAKHGIAARRELESIKQSLSGKNKSKEHRSSVDEETTHSSFLPSNLSRAERSIINVLLNADMPLGYDDIARALGKSESTVRDHISSIRRKSDIVEVVESSDRRKLFRIPVALKNRILY